MIKKKYVTIGFLALCLAVTLLLSVTITSSENVYDPWADITGDGLVNIWDLSALSDAWLTTGTPVHKKGNISVPAAAFVPENRTMQLYGYNYIENHEDTYVRCMAPVQLPDGATVTNFTSYWWDGGYGDIGCILTSYYATQIYRDMAWASSSGTAGYGSSYSEYGIEYATVDNGIYAYIVEINIPASVSHHDYKFYYAIIEWEYLP